MECSSGVGPVPQPLRSTCASTSQMLWVPCSWSLFHRSCVYNQCVSLYAKHTLCYFGRTGGCLCLTATATILTPSAKQCTRCVLSSLEITELMCPLCGGLSGQSYGLSKRCQVCQLWSSCFPQCPTVFQGGRALWLHWRGLCGPS